MQVASGKDRKVKVRTMRVEPVTPICDHDRQEINNLLEWRKRLKKKKKKEEKEKSFEKVLDNATKEWYT